MSRGAREGRGTVCPRPHTPALVPGASPCLGQACHGRRARSHKERPAKAAIRDHNAPLPRSPPYSSPRTLEDRLAGGGRICQRLTCVCTQKAECVQTAPCVPHSSPLNKPDSREWRFKQLLPTHHRQQVTIVRCPPRRPLPPAGQQPWKKVARSLPSMATGNQGQPPPSPRPARDP